MLFSRFNNSYDNFNKRAAHTEKFFITAHLKKGVPFFFRDTLKRNVPMGGRRFKRGQEL